MRRFDSLTHATQNGEWINYRDDASIVRLINELDRASVNRACLVGIEGYIDNDCVREYAKAYPAKFVPIAGFNPVKFDNAQAINHEIKSIAEQGWAGIKLHPRLNNYDCSDLRLMHTMESAGKYGLILFIDTLFRQKLYPSGSPSDIIDRTVARFPDTQTVLLHGGGPNLLEVFDLVRMHKHLILDLSFTVMRYAGSSLDADISFVCKNLDQRVVVGSDMPEYTPTQAFNRIEELAKELNKEKISNIFFKNLENLFSSWNPLKLS